MAEPQHASELFAGTRCLIMGICNVTPDSFSDGGQWFDPEAAVAHVREMLAQGADIIDIGGESTRPGAGRVGVEEELRRVLPVIEAARGLANAVPVSVDTMSAAVAQAAIEAGAGIVNDVSGGLADPGIFRVVAEAGVPYILMHWRGQSDVMDSLDVYGDVVSEVCEELSRRVELALTAGLRPEQIIVDPGLGFAKKGMHNWPLLAHIDALKALGFPVLIGASRKRFIGDVVYGEHVTAREGRDAATAAVSALAAEAGAWAVRVHDVASSVDAVRVAQAWHNAKLGGTDPEPDTRGMREHEQG